MITKSQGEAAMKLCVCGKPHYAKGLCKTCWQREWAKAHKETRKTYYQKHRKEVAEKAKRWRKAHPDYQRSDLKRETCKIIKQHAQDLKDDPERLRTAFIQNIIGIKCKKEKI